MTNKLFGGMTSDGMEEAQDRLGGFQPMDSGAYPAKITALYAGEADSGARNLTLIADIGGREFRETIYFTNKKGENFYTTKNNKKAPLPGFITVDHLCLVATGAPLSEQETEEKTVNVYDSKAQRELPKQVQMLAGCIGQTVELGILRVIENKNKKDNSGNYVPIAETREFNSIDKVFDLESKMTVVEAQNEAEEAGFYPAWVEKNTGQTRDKREIRDGAGGGNSTAGEGSSSGTARTSLFSKKG